VQKTIFSTADVARLFNVTETTVKRWADEAGLKCQKTPGGHRRFQVRNVVEFAERNNFEPVATLELPGSDRMAGAIQMAVLERDYPKLVEAFVDRAMSPDRRDLALFLVYLYEHKVAQWEIYDLVVRPGMQSIGEKWVKGEIDVAQEHRASHETLEALSRLQTEVVIRQPVGMSVLCACLDSEMHEIGLRSAYYIFEAEGWHTVYLGSRTPLASLVRTVAETRPDVICVSVTGSDNCQEIEQKLRQIRQIADSHGGRVVLGGRLAKDLSFDRSLVDAGLTSSRELIEFIGATLRKSGRGAIAAPAPGA
jgi:excisionase family DNA binding protein